MKSSLKILSFLCAVIVSVAGAHAENERVDSIPISAGLEVVLPEPVATSDDPVANNLEAAAASRNAVLELAGAFSNDGYKIRDGYWSGLIAPGSSVVLEVNLFTGNEYWFCAASSPGLAQGLTLTVFDGQGQILDQQRYLGESRTAAGIEPVASGRYFVRISLTSENPALITFLYCYK